MPALCSSGSCLTAAGKAGSMRTSWTSTSTGSDATTKTLGMPPYRRRCLPDLPADHGWNDLQNTVKLQPGAVCNRVGNAVHILITDVLRAVRDSVAGTLLCRPQGQTCRQAYTQHLDELEAKRNRSGQRLREAWHQEEQRRQERTLKVSHSLLHCLASIALSSEALAKFP